MITPNRKTRIFVDSNDNYQVVDSGFSVRRTKGEIFAHRKNIKSIKLTSLGWRVRAKIERFHQTKDGDLSLIPRKVWTTFEAPPQFFSEKNSESRLPNSELTNINPGSKTTWAPVLQKIVKTDTDFETTKLPPKVYSYMTDPEPFEIPSDRVFLTSDNISEKASFAFLGEFYGTTKNGYGNLLRFYFAGPASKFGSGKLCLVINGDDEVQLKEWVEGQGAWKTVSSKHVQTSVQTDLGGKIYVSFFIEKDYFTLKYPKVIIGGSYIEFPTAGTAEVDRLLDVERIKNQFNVNVDSSFSLSFLGGRPSLDQSLPIALDLRRDLFGHFQIYYFDFPEYVIDVVDSAIGVDNSGLNDNIIWLTWDYYTEDTTNTYIDVELYDADGNLIIPIGISERISNTYVQRRNEYVPIQGNRNYRVKFKFKAYNLVSPYLQSYIIQQAPKIVVGELNETEISVPARISSFSLVGATNDLSQETANIEFNDLANLFTQFDNRSSIFVRVEVEEGDKKCVLFRGYAQRTDSYVKGRFDQSIFSGFPVKFWKNRKLTLSGPWLRLKQQYIKEFIQTLEGEKQYVVDLLSYLLTNAGFECDFPSSKELPIRFVPQTNTDYNLINPGMNLYDVVMDIVKIYTGCYLIWDNNAGTKGKFKLLFPPRPPYIPKVNFTSTKVWDPAEENRLEMYLPSYVQTVEIPGDPPTQESVIHCPIIANTFSHYVRPPEANKITVGYLTRMSKDEWYGQITMINPKSYNFFPGNPTADKESPDYLGYELPMWVNEPLLIGDKELANESAKITAEEGEIIPVSSEFPLLYAYAKRIYDLAAHAVKMVTFEAPLVFIPHEDDPDKVRPLRYYDPVTLNGIPYLVRSVNPAYTKDGHQKAIYELEMPRI